MIFASKIALSSLIFVHGMNSFVLSNADVLLSVHIMVVIILLILLHFVYFVKKAYLIFLKIPKMNPNLLEEDCF